MLQTQSAHFLPNPLIVIFYSILSLNKNSILDFLYLIKTEQFLIGRG